MNRAQMKLVKLLVAAIVAALAYFYLPKVQQQIDRPLSSELLNAIETRASDVQVCDKGVIIKVLPDDEHGSRHQRFILRLANGNTLLIAHNIDLAPRIAGPRPGDVVEFFGEYEWNEKGGVVHWTHHDPSGRHPGGWLKHAGIKYE